MRKIIGLSTALLVVLVTMSCQAEKAEIDNPFVLVYFNDTRYVYFRGDLVVYEFSSDPGRGGHVSYPITKATDTFHFVHSNKPAEGTFVKTRKIVDDCSIVQGYMLQISYPSDQTSTSFQMKLSECEG